MNSIDALPSWSELSPKQQQLILLQERARRQSTRKFDLYYPDDGPLRRELYPKHMEFFAAGAKYRERCFMAANRVGKTEGGGGYEMTAHLTGRYPKWWEGRRFDHPIFGQMAGKTNETTRDILMPKMFGPTVYDGNRKSVAGTGLIPGDMLGAVTWKKGIADLADTVRVRHVSGGWSQLAVKSYEQGRGAFEGTEQHVIWDDEEPPASIYGEQLIRIATTRGIIMLTFTPLEGMSEIVLSFMPKEMTPGA